MKTIKIPTLSAHQEKVYKAFDKADTDIDIAVIYTRVYGDPGHLTAREMQMKLGPVFAAMNKKWYGNGQPCVIVPGETKRTYRYSTEG